MTTLLSSLTTLAVITGIVFFVIQIFNPFKLAKKILFGSFIVALILITVRMFILSSL
jgi:hypothetical protein